MVVAREQCRQRAGAPAEKMVAYTSSQAHSSLQKGARMTGFGHIRLLDVDSDFAVRPEALIEAIGADGKQVWCRPSWARTWAPPAPQPSIP